jgi:hypothetical protein
MSRSISFITIVGAALALAAPAFGEPRPETPQWHQALMARSEGMNQANGLGVYALQSSQGLTDRSADATVSQVGTGAQVSQGLTDRSADTTVGQSGEQVAIVALELRSEALNRQYGLGEYANSGMDRLIARERAFEPTSDAAFPPDAFERAVNASTRQSGPEVVVESSGREIEWPQFGIGLGIALLLGLGIVLAVRSTRARPLAH